MTPWVARLLFLNVVMYVLTLAVPGLGPLQGLTELIHLAVAADERCQPAPGGGLEPRSRRPRPRSR